MRLFVAIQLSEEMRDGLCLLQSCFVKEGVKGNYTPRENLHLTLTFIGEFSDWEGALQVVESICLQPFELRLKGIGAFGDLWWVGLEDSDPLNSYVKSLRRGLASAAIPFDRKSFRPHITIIRRARMCGGPIRLPVPRASMWVERASLMRSDRGRNGMIYTEIQ